MCKDEDFFSDQGPLPAGSGFIASVTSSSDDELEPAAAEDVPSLEDFFSDQEPLPARPGSMALGLPSSDDEPGPATVEDDCRQCVAASVELRAALVAEAALLHVAGHLLPPWRSSLRQPPSREVASRFLDAVHDVSVEALTCHAVSKLCLAGPAPAVEKRVACAALLELISTACPAALQPHLTRLCNWFQGELPVGNLDEEGRWSAARICRALADAFNYQGEEHQAFIELDSACCLKASLLAVVDRPPNFGALLDRQRIWFTRAVAQCLCSISTRLPGGLMKLQARAEGLATTLLAASKDSQVLVDNAPKQAAVAHKAWVLGALLEGCRSQIDTSVLVCALAQALSALCLKGPGLLQQALLPCVACLLGARIQLPLSCSSLIQALHQGLLSKSKAVCARATEAVGLILASEAESRAAGATHLQVDDLQALVKVQPALLKILCASRNRALAQDAALAMSSLSSLSRTLIEAGSPQAQLLVPELPAAQLPLVEPPAAQSPAATNSPPAMVAAGEPCAEEEGPPLKKRSRKSDGEQQVIDPLSVDAPNTLGNIGASAGVGVGVAAEVGFIRLRPTRQWLIARLRSMDAATSSVPPAAGTSAPSAPRKRRKPICTSESDGEEHESSDLTSKLIPPSVVAATVSDNATGAERVTRTGGVLDGLGPESKVKDMHARLREFKQPAYGTKAQLWERLQKAAVGNQADVSINLRPGRANRGGA